jgi:hypothetical protein
MTFISFLTVFCLIFLGSNALAQNQTLNQLMNISQPVNIWGNGETSQNYLSIMTMCSGQVNISQPLPVYDFVTNLQSINDSFNLNCCIQQPGNGTPFSCVYWNKTLNPSEEYATLLNLNLTNTTSGTGYEAICSAQSVNPNMSMLQGWCYFNMPKVAPPAPSTPTIISSAATPNFSFSMHSQFLVNRGEPMWIIIDAKNEGLASAEFIFTCYVPINGTATGNATWAKQINIGGEYSAQIEVYPPISLNDNYLYNINCEVRQSVPESTTLISFPLTVSAPFYIQSMATTSIIGLQINQSFLSHLPLWIIYPVLMLITFLIRTRVDKIKDRRGRKKHPNMSLGLLIAIVLFFLVMLMSILG